MQIYEEQNPFQSFQGGGGFNPVNEPDVAGAMERELRRGEQRDQLYYDSMTRNDQQRVRNAQADARKIANDIDNNLKVLSKFSKTITDVLDKKNVQKMKDKMAAASMLAYDDEVYANGETTKFEKEEANVQEGQNIVDAAAAQYEANGGSPIAGERLRSLSGNERIAYERTRLSLLSAEYPNYIQRNLSYLNAPGISTEERDARRRQVAQQYLVDTGAVGVSPGMLNKYLLRRMREVDSKATNAWVAAEEKDILLGRQRASENDLLIGAESGNIGPASLRYLEERMAQGTRPNKARDELFTLLQNNEKLLNSQAIKDLADTPYTHSGFNGGKPSTFGKVFRGQIAKLEDAVANNQDRAVQNAALKLEAERQNGINNFKLEVNELEAKGGRLTDAQKIKVMEDWTRDKLGEIPDVIKDYVTVEDFSINSGKEKLRSIYEKEGFITRDDLNDLNPALKNDTEVQKWIDDGSILRDRTKQQKDDVEDRIKGLATDISGVSGTAINKGDRYGRTIMGVRKDVRAQYMSNLRSGKYTSPDGTVDYDGALNDAVDKVKQGAYDPKTNPNGKKYDGESTASERATRGNREYIERIQLAADGVKNNPKYLAENNISTPEELEQAQKVITTGTGDYPGIYKDLAEGSPNITPYDIAMTQLNAAGIKVEPQQTEEIVKAQDETTQRLLNYKNNLNRTERAFTPNNNAPGTVDPLAAVYVTGNIGPTSTGQHLDVKRTDGSYFEYKDLDGFVEVDDPEFGRVPLSRVPETGDWQSHTVRGSHGRDYGTYSGSNIYLTNGARVVDSVSTVHGDRLQIELPNGKRFFFLHGTSRKVQTVPKPQTQTTTPQLNKTLTPQEIGNTLQSAGWPSHLIPTMMAVGMAESGGRAGVDTRQSGLDPNMRNEYSIGIFQINYKVHKQLVSSMGYTEQDLRDPTVNAKVALRIYQMQGLGAWGAYTNGSYRNFL